MSRVRETPRGGSGDGSGMRLTSGDRPPEEQLHDAAIDAARDDVGVAVEQAQHPRVIRVDPGLEMRAPAPLGRLHDRQQQARAEAASLPVVAHDDGDLGRAVVDRFVLRERDEVAGGARRARLGDDPETCVVVDVREFASPLGPDTRKRREEPLRDRACAETREEVAEALVVGGTDRAHEDVGGGRRCAASLPARRVTGQGSSRPRFHCTLSGTTVGRRSRSEHDGPQCRRNKHRRVSDEVGESAARGRRSRAQVWVDPRVVVEVSVTELMLGRLRDQAVRPAPRRLTACPSAWRNPGQRRPSRPRPSRLRGGR
jgi:hypothetical protein